MKITKNTVVTVKYKLSDTQGNVIEEGVGPMVYLHGGYGNTLPGIEAALEGKEIGYVAEIQLEPEDAFGDYDADLVKVEPRSRLPGVVEVGMQFEGIPDDDEDGIDDELIYTVTDIADDQVVLDANHPFAGIALRFNLQVSNVRAATEEEIKHQHVHDSYGFHDDDDDDDDEEGDAADEYRTHSIH